MRAVIAASLIAASSLFVWYAPESGSPFDPTIAGYDADVVRLVLFVATAVVSGALVRNWSAMLLVPAGFLVMYTLIDSYEILILDKYYETPPGMRTLIATPYALLFLGPPATLGALLARLPDVRAHLQRRRHHRNHLASR